MCVAKFEVRVGDGILQKVLRRALTMAGAKLLLGAAPPGSYDDALQARLSGMLSGGGGGTRIDG